LVQGDFPALSPDGRRIAYCQTRRYNHSDPANAALVLLDLATGQPTVLLRPGEIISHPCWSPRGDRLGFLMLTEGCSEGVPFLFRSVEGRGCEGGKR
jgi:Tol biopolymer transport system component